MISQKAINNEEFLNTVNSLNETLNNIPFTKETRDKIDYFLDELTVVFNRVNL